MQGGGWNALSEAACPAALPERTVWGPPAPRFNPQVFDLERQERAAFDVHLSRGHNIKDSPSSWGKFKYRYLLLRIANVLKYAL